MSSSVQLPQRLGQEGNRWINQRPTANEIAVWFKTVTLHDGMQHEDWVSGVTLIQATEKSDEVVGFDSDGRPQIVPDVQNVVYIPYPKVETRTAYFDRLMEISEDLTGFVLPVAAPDSKGMSVGFFSMKVAMPGEKVATMVCYTARMVVLKGDVEWVEVEDADGIKRRYPTGNVIKETYGTKSVPLLDRWGKVDANAVMKAETGAKGRALGFGGMLVIPGTGVATAEDIQESQRQDGGGTPGVAVAAEAPVEPEGGGDVSLMEHLAGLYGRMEAQPEVKAEFQEWARERGYGKASELAGPDLKAVVKKAEALLRQLDLAESAPQLDLSQ